MLRHLHEQSETERVMGRMESREKRRLFSSPSHQNSRRDSLATRVYPQDLATYPSHSTNARVADSSSFSVQTTFPVLISDTPAGRLALLPYSIYTYSEIKVQALHYSDKPLSTFLLSLAFSSWNPLTLDDSGLQLKGQLSHQLEWQVRVVLRN